MYERIVIIVLVDSPPTMQAQMESRSHRVRSGSLSSGSESEDSSDGRQGLPRIKSAVMQVSPYEHI